MTRTHLPQARRASALLPVWAALGAVVAGFFVYVFTDLRDDPSMWVLPVVAFGAAAGVVGGAMFQLADPLRRRGARRAANALSVLLFFLVLKVAFVAARHGPL